MIDLDDWIRELDEQPDREIIDHAAYQKQLFSEYVIRNDDNKEKRQELLKRFKNRGNTFRRKRTSKGTCCI